MNEKRRDEEFEKRKQMKILSIQTILDDVFSKNINKNLFDHIIGNENRLQELGINLTKFYESTDENG